MSVGLVVTITMFGLKMETIAFDYVADCAGCLLLYYIMFFIHCFFFYYRISQDGIAVKTRIEWTCSPTRVNQLGHTLEVSSSAEQGETA